MNYMNVIIVIPTYNGGELWREVAEAISLEARELKIKKIITIDSSSTDDTVLHSKNSGFEVEIINSKDFNHGATRNLKVYEEECDIVVFFTQDVIPEKGCISELIRSFDDLNVSCIYGRQLPHLDANPIAKHARLFNYKDESYCSSLSSIKKLGIKSVFLSNSFSAYRVSIFKELGGFPKNTILCEDMYLGAKAVLAGYKIAYASTAKVRHSHNYSFLDEFKRYFDIGVFHKNEKWIHENFGGAGGEGKKFIISELRYLFRNNPLWITNACINNFAKFLGYKAGKNYKLIPTNWCRKLSMHKRYWDSLPG